MVASGHLNSSTGLFVSAQQEASTANQEVVLIDPQHPQRALAEAMVREVYDKAFGASLSAFYPYLLAIRGQDGDFCAVAGLRPGDQPLFSENYLSRPVEEILQTPRQEIVELGNLATQNTGQIRWIIAAATAFLQGAGFSQVLFTVVPLLYNSFRRMGLPLHHLAPALAECLPAEQRKDWGSYYQCNPAVYTGRIAYGYHALAKVVAKSDILEHIWQEAFHAGQQAAEGLRGVGR